MQMCEATDRNRIVKAEGVEASWHMTAKPTGSTPTVNAALVHRQFATRTWGDLRRMRCKWMTTSPGLVAPGYQDPSAVASCPLRVEETGSNVIHEHSATRSNELRDGAQVSSGHSRYWRRRNTEGPNNETQGADVKASSKSTKPERARCGRRPTRTEP